MSAVSLRDLFMSSFKLFHHAAQDFVPGMQQQSVIRVWIPIIKFWGPWSALAYHTKLWITEWNCDLFIYFLLIHFTVPYLVSILRKFWMHPIWHLSKLMVGTNWWVDKSRWWADVRRNKTLVIWFVFTVNTFTFCADNVKKICFYALLSYFLALRVI